MQQVYLRDNWPDDLLRALGQLVVAMGQLDYTLDLSLKRAWRLPYQEGMTKAQDFYRASSKLKEIGNQLPQNDQEASREFEAIERGINCLYGEPN